MQYAHANISIRLDSQEETALLECGRFFTYLIYLEQQCIIYVILGAKYLFYFILFIDLV